MFNDSVSFNGGTRVEVITVLANCGRDTDRARRALVTWIKHKQEKHRSTEHILAKLRDIESKFIKDTSLHSAFRDARAETFLPRPPDLPLPDSLRRRSGSQPTTMTVSAPPLLVPTHARPNSMGSVAEHPSPLTPSTHSSRGSQISDLSLGRSEADAGRRPASQPQPVPRLSDFPSPPIQIPRERQGWPCASSPITSSPEDSGIHLRYHHFSHPAGSSSSSQSHGPIPSHSASTPASAPPFHRQHSDPRGYPYPDAVPPDMSPPMQAARARPRGGVPRSPGTSSSEESDFRSRYHQMSRTVGHMSPGRSRVTPPKTNPPDVPLPPIPSDDQGTEPEEDEASTTSLLIEQPPTPVRSMTVHPSTPLRPLPIQPIPSPVPGSEEWEQLNTLSEHSLRPQYWRGSTGELPLMREVARQDSPVCAFHDDDAVDMGISPPPPYMTPLDIHDISTIGDALDRAVSICGGSYEVQSEVFRCIKFHRGYEPPYWQTRLQACGLSAEAARYLVDEMSKQVDWATSFSRTP